MRKLLHLIGLFLCVLTSCQKPFQDPEDKDVSIIYDIDAKKFIDSSAITDSIEKIAINDLVKQLKSSSLWTKFMAIYPMVGGTGNSTKWNLKDPRDLDQAYRLTFYGTPTYANTGILFPTISDYADTHLADSALSFNNNSIAYYSRTQNTISGYDMGCADDELYYNQFSIYHAWDGYIWFGYFQSNMQPSNTIGLFMLSSTANNVKRYENGISTGEKGSAPTTGFTNLPILIGKAKGASSGGERECCLASIGRGLTDTEALTFYTIVQNFETALGR